MFERFTERARQVVVLAQGAARDERIGYIGVEQILLGLLAEEEGLAAKALDHLGVTFDKAAVSVNSRITGRAREDEELKSQLPFTPRAKAVLEKALREALSLGHNYIGTEHILLGLVRENEGGAVEILRDDFSLTPEKVRNEVIRMLSGPKAPILQRPAVTADRLPHGRVNTPANEEELKKLIDMAIHLGRQYPDVPSTRIVHAVLVLHNKEGDT